MWHGKWFILGLLSSIGIGTGAHTFLLFLGPFIGRVTTTAFACDSLDFNIGGVGAMICTVRTASTPVTFTGILAKVAPTALAWGVGTAIGELPPYLIARASAQAGRSSGETRRIEMILSKPSKSRTLLESGQLFSFQLVERLGFFGILCCASVSYESVNV